MATQTYNFPLDPNGHSESELITALYLYGDQVKIRNGNVVIPKDEGLLDSSLIRPELIVTANATNQTALNINIAEAEVDAVNYMTNGPGRFGNGYQFDLVKAFFGKSTNEMSSRNGEENYLFDPAKLNSLGSPAYDTQGNLIGKKYTKQDIDEIYFQDNLDIHSASLELRNYYDVSDNYNQRIYVWNSQVFSISNNA